MERDRELAGWCWQQSWASGLRPRLPPTPDHRTQLLFALHCVSGEYGDPASRWAVPSMGLQKAGVGIAD